MVQTEFKNTVMGQITKDALMNWNGLGLEEAEKQVQEYGTADIASNNVTYGSELNSIRGIAQAIGLTEEQTNQLIADINTKDKVSPKLALEISEKMQAKGLEQTIIKILEVVHDGWVKDNPNKFEARPKNYQFVTLKLLDFKEASLDLLFLQPILEACGLDIDRASLKEEFLQEQEQYLQEQAIYSHEDLVAKLSMGAEFYPVLEGLETNKGVKEGERTLITELLKDSTIVEKMATQVEEKIVMPNFAREDSMQSIFNESSSIAQDVNKSETMKDLLGDIEKQDTNERETMKDLLGDIEKQDTNERETMKDLLGDIEKQDTNERETMKDLLGDIEMQDSFGDDDRDTMADIAQLIESLEDKMDIVTNQRTQIANKKKELSKTAQLETEKKGIER